MLTENQQRKLFQSLKQYKKRYLVKRNEELDEAATRLMINYFLTEVLGYKELEEIKTEYSIRGMYADYVIQTGGKNRMVIEVKAIQLDLNDKHLRQAGGYAADEGIDWILLTNGNEFQLYRLIFSKPINRKLVFKCNLKEEGNLKGCLDFFGRLTRNSLKQGDLEKYWKHFQAMEPANLAKHLYSQSCLRLLKRALRKEAKISFDEEDILDSIHLLVTTKIESQKPKLKMKRKLKVVPKHHDLRKEGTLDALFQSNHEP